MNIANEGICARIEDLDKSRENAFDRAFGARSIERCCQGRASSVPIGDLDEPYQCLLAICLVNRSMQIRCDRVDLAARVRGMCSRDEHGRMGCSSPSSVTVRIKAQDALRRWFDFRVC